MVEVANIEEINIKIECDEINGENSNDTAQCESENVSEIKAELDVSEPTLNQSFEQAFGSFICTQCGIEFPTKALIDEHTMNHQDCETKPHRCDMCGMDFEEGALLKLHCDSNHSEDNHHIQLKGKKNIKTKISQLKHKLTSTQINIATHVRSEPSFKCDRCDQSYATRARLESHIRIHTMERPFVCDQCDKRFITFGGANAHKKAHQTRERSYKCTICNKSFFSASILQSHMTVHSSERPYGCEKCGKRYKKKNALTAHPCAAVIRYK